MRPKGSVMKAPTKKNLLDEISGLKAQLASAINERDDWKQKYAELLGQASIAELLAQGNK